MTTNDIDDTCPLLDQTYFALDAKGFTALQNMLDNPPAPTERLRRTLAASAPWGATGAFAGKTQQEL